MVPYFDIVVLMKLAHFDKKNKNKNKKLEENREGVLCHFGWWNMGKERFGWVLGGGGRFCGPTRPVTGSIKGR